jgi:phage-related minor tail protein
MYKAQLDAENAYAKEFYDRAEYQLTDSYKRNEAFKNAFEDLFKGMGDAIVDFALTGKTSFSDMVNSMIVGLIKLEMQMAMTNMYKSMGGSQGIISTITSAFTGTPVASAKGNVFDSGNMQAFAKGGAFTNGIVSSPTSFNMGLMGEAGPEAIMPLRRGSDGSLGVAASGGSSGGNVSVQVINNSSSQATTNETTDSKGNRKIEVVIGDMTAGEISRSGSASQKSIKSTFGIQPQLIRR